MAASHQRRSLLDEVVGGVVPGLPVALCGQIGSGRTVLCIEQVHGALARGEVVAFLTPEPGRLLIQQAASMSLPLKRPLRQRRLRLLELEPDAPATLRAAGGQALAEAILEEAPGARLVVVDPFTALTSELLDEREMRGAVRDFFEPFAAADCAVVATVELEALEESRALTRAIKDGCGIFAELDVDDDEGHLLRVTKARTGRHADGPVAFRVGPRGPAREDETPRATAPRPEPTPRKLAVRNPAPRTSVAPPAPVALAPTPPEPALQERHFPASAARELREPATPEPERASGEPARVLIVEDDGVTRTMLRDWLSPSYHLEEARDGFAAVSAVLHRQPDLVVLDLNLPRASGFEVLRVLRGAGVTRPVLVVSANLARASDRIRSLVLGASDLLAKPVNRFELLHKVDGLLRYAPVSTPSPAAEDAEALLGEESPRRTIEDPVFRARLERSLYFGDQFGLPSTLLAVRAPTADALDTFIGAAERRLRPEDAVLAVSKSRALLLLVACPVHEADPVMSRLASAIEESDASARGLRYRAVEAHARGEDEDWADLFDDLQPWPRKHRA